MYESKKWQDVFSTGSPKAEREARSSNAGGWVRARGASGGWWERAQCVSREWWVGEIPVLPLSPLSQLGNVTQKWIRAISNITAIIPTRLIFEVLVFLGIEFLRALWLNLCKMSLSYHFAALYCNELKKILTAYRDIFFYSWGFVIVGLCCR